MAASFQSPRRSNARWLLLALSLAAIAVLGLTIPSINTWRDRDVDPTQTVVKLAVPAMIEQKKDDCEPVSTERLQRATTAVAGTFVTNDAGVATFRADHWFRGGPADLVTVSTTSAADLASALNEAGLSLGRVLIASRSGVVLTCGESAAYSTELASEYVKAFDRGGSSAG